MLRRTFLALCLTFAVSLTLSSQTFYCPPAIGDFDGSADYLSRASGLTGTTDSKTGIVSFFFRLDGGDGTFLKILESSGNYFSVYRHSTDRIYVIGRKEDATGIITKYTQDDFVADGIWRHFLLSINTADKIQIYVDDVANLHAGGVFADGVIDYTRGAWIIGASSGFANRFNGTIAELYFAPGQYLDFSVTANRRKFISAAGYPVSLGADGSLPTGTAPIIYMRERANNCGINAGTGGDFVINGAPLHDAGPVPFVPLPTLIPARGRGSRIHGGIQ